MIKYIMNSLYGRKAKKGKTFDMNNEYPYSTSKAEVYIKERRKIIESTNFEALQQNITRERLLREETYILLQEGKHWSVIMKENDFLYSLEGQPLLVRNDLLEHLIFFNRIKY